MSEAFVPAEGLGVHLVNVQVFILLCITLLLCREFCPHIFVSVQLEPAD